MALWRGAEVPSGAPRHEKAGTCLLEKTRGLDELHSGPSYGAASLGFHANDSNVQIK